MQSTETPVVVVGAGIAGLVTALRLVPMPVTVIAQGALGGECATQLAQGGIAAAIGPDDTPEQHAADTKAAAAGLGDETVARDITGEAREAIDWLVKHRVRFDRDGAGQVALGLEAAHGRPRVLHAGGDRTGREVLRALVAATRATSSIELVEHATVDSLTPDHNGTVEGVLLRRAGIVTSFRARAVVLATGGIGGLFAHTTNPLTSVGSGLALGARAGAILRDLEFVQFHPTAIDVGRDPMPLASEALRGAGAVLVNARGEDVMSGVPGGALAARDVVAATVFARCAQGERVFLELSNELLRDFPKRFPGIATLCAGAGIDLAHGRIPVRPAAHYHMGGLKVDTRGRTSVEGLWACGEVASTGFHGGNRLASNSLLEAVVCARAVAEDLKGIAHLHLVRSNPRGDEGSVPAKSARDGGQHAALRRLMDLRVGVIRNEDGLTEVVLALAPLVFGAVSAMRDVDLTALLIALSALARRESRGAHRRSDYPAAGARRSQELTLDTACKRALELTAVSASSRRVALQ